MSEKNLCTSKSGCMAGRMNAIDYLKNESVKNIIEQIVNSTGSKANIQMLIELTSDLKDLPTYTNAIIKSGAINEFLNVEFTDWHESRQLIKSYANQVPDNTFQGIHYETYEQIFRTMVGLKVYLKTKLPNGTLVNKIQDKKEAINQVAKTLELFNTDARIFDVGYAREAIGNIAREAGKTDNSAIAIIAAAKLADKWRDILDNVNDSDCEEVFADVMENISLTAKNTKNSKNVNEIIKQEMEAIKDNQTLIKRCKGKSHCTM